MRYPDSHWEEVAKRYHETSVHWSDLEGGKTEETVRIAQVQNHYPHVTQNTVRIWIKKCRAKGFL